jgi:transposase InsO family protein
MEQTFRSRSVPTHIRSDNGPEFIAKAVQAWITAVGAQTAYITPGSPWENGYIDWLQAASTRGFIVASAAKPLNGAARPNKSRRPAAPSAPCLRPLQLLRVSDRP